MTFFENILVVFGGILSLIVFLFGLLKGYQKVKEIEGKNKKLSLEHYLKASDILLGKKKANFIAIEKAFREIYKIKGMTANEIEYFLKRKNPTYLLGLYKGVRNDFIIFDDLADEIIFKEKLQKKGNRLAWTSFYLVGYVVMAFLWIFPPILFSNGITFGVDKESFRVLSVFLLVICIPLQILCLVRAVKLKKSEFFEELIKKEDEIADRKKQPNKDNGKMMLPKEPSLTKFSRVYLFLIHFRYCSSVVEGTNYYKQFITSTDHLRNLKSILGIRGTRKRLRYIWLGQFSKSYNDLQKTGNLMFEIILDEIFQLLTKGKLKEAKKLADATHNLPKSVVLNRLKEPGYGNVNLDAYTKNDGSEALRKQWEALKALGQAAESLVS